MHRSLTSPRNLSRGVTLIETSIVVAIAAVSMTTVAPSFSGFIENRRVDGVASGLQTDIQFVRQEAVLRNQALRLSFYVTSDYSCYVAHTGNHADCGCDAGGNATCAAPVQIIKTVALSAADKVSVVANVSSILFDPLHGTSTPTGTLKVTAKSGRAVHHVVNVMGRVRSCSPHTNVPAVAGYRAC